MLDVIRHVQPAVLVGVSGQGGIFTEQVVRGMAEHSGRPVIFPLSNATNRSEATPQHLMNWTSGRALVGTGTAFSSVKIGGREEPIAQTNNSYIFPGLAVGIVASKARRVTDAMIKAAAQELATRGFCSVARNSSRCSVQVRSLPAEAIMADTRILVSSTTRIRPC